MDLNQLDKPLVPSESYLTKQPTDSFPLSSDVATQPTSYQNDCQTTSSVVEDDDTDDCCIFCLECVGCCAITMQFFQCCCMLAGCLALLK
jgi:hypothetical protein